MRLLVVAPFLPDVRAAHGGGIYLGTLCEALAERAELRLVAFARPDEMARATSGALPFRHVEAIPAPGRPAGGSMVRHQALMLMRWGARRMPLVVAKAHSRAMARAIEREVAEARPDAVLVEVAQMAQYLPVLRSVPTVFTDHENGMPGNARTDLGPWADRRDERLWQRYVQRFYRQADLLQAVTQEDADALAQQLDRPVALRLPVVKVAAAPQPCEKAPPRALFVGNYSHRPNPEAAEFLVHSILPRMRQQRRDVELWFAGPHADRLDDLAQHPGVRVLGYVDDLPSLFAQVRLLLAPLYSGAGFRMKNLAAMAHGVPVVTNKLGARGFDAPAPARTVAETPEELAAAALGLLNDPKLCAAAGRQAHAWALEHVGPSVVAQTQIERIEALLRAQKPR